MNRKKLCLFGMLIALCGVLALSGCSKSGDGDKDGSKDGGGASAEKAETQEPKGPDFGSMPEDLCDLESIKTISMDVIDNQVFIVTDQENLWGGQTIDDLVEMSKSMAEGFMDIVPEPENCEVRGAAVTCDEALETLNKANGGAYDLEVMKKNMDTLGVEECGVLTQEMDAWGSRYKTLYYVGKIDGQWKNIFTVSQQQLDMHEDKDKEEETSEGE